MLLLLHTQSRGCGGLSRTSVLLRNALRQRSSAARCEMFEAEVTKVMAELAARQHDTMIRYAKIGVFERLLDDANDSWFAISLLPEEQWDAVRSRSARRSANGCQQPGQATPNETLDLIFPPSPDCWFGSREELIDIGRKRAVEIYESRDK